MSAGAWIAAGLLFLAVTWFEVYFVYGIIRSIQKKPINRPPSEKWVRICAEIVSQEFVEQENLKTHEVSNVLKYIVKYNYNGKSYTGKIGGYALKGKKVNIYCRKKNPSVIKEYVPEQSWSLGIIISAGFMAGFLVLCEVVLFMQLFRN